MSELTHWHPVILCRDVAEQPVAVTLLGQPLVIWRSPTQGMQAFADQCPHRGARLSLGQVVHGRLECPYHGWQFAPQGACVHVPAVPNWQPPASHAAQSFCTQEAYGLVWVCLQDGSRALPGFAADADSRLRTVHCGPYDLATSAPRVVENFLDMAHFAFVHEHWLGARSATAIDDYSVTPTPTGLLATGCKAWQPQATLHATAPAQVAYSYEVTAPYAALLTKIPQADSSHLPDYRESIALFICPITPESCRVWFALAVADFHTPEAQLQDFQNTIFLQDKPVLESQQPKRLPLQPGAEVHCAADKASAAYRRFLRDSGIAFGVAGL